jgi:AcrR family transcriptional regulator
VSASSAAVKPTILSREAWLDAGQDVLRESGVRALKLRPLAERLSISTGSFYHHFASFDDYLGALAAHYSGPIADNRLRALRALKTGPREKLAAMIDLTERERLGELGLAMRAWARGDERAAASVRKLDAAVLHFVADCLADMGFDEADAHLRAYMLLSVAGADIRLPAKAGSRHAASRRILEILSR